MAVTEPVLVASDAAFEEPEGDLGFSVNSTTAGAQSGATYARFTDGSFAVAFTSSDTAANGIDIRLRVFNFDGTPAGSDFVVSQTIAGDQASPALLALNDGSMLVTWRTPDPANAANSLLMGRIFDSSGTALSGEVQISASGADGSYALIQRSTGSLLFAYQNDGEIIGRVFNASLQSLTTEVQLNTTLPGTPTNLGLTTLANGNYLLRWTSPDGLDGSGTAIRNRVFSSTVDAWSPVTLNGTTNDFQVNTTTAGDQTVPRASRLANGTVLEVWQSTDGGDGSGSTIRARVIAGTGDAGSAAPEFVFNTTTAGDQASPTILNFEDWRRLVWWHSQEQGSDVIRGRWVYADGSYGASDFAITTLPDTGVSNFSLGLLSDQTLLAVYSGAASGDGSGGGIQARQIQSFGMLFPAANPDPGVPFDPITPGESYFLDTSLPSYDWDQAALQISRGNAPFANGVGNAYTMTYAYRSNTSGLPPMASGATGYARFNSTMITAAENAIQLWEDLANINLVRVMDAGSQYSNNAQFTLWQYTGSISGTAPQNASGYGGYRLNGATWQNYVYLNNQKTSVTAPTVANDGVRLLIHEIGHALGLSHPADYNIGPVGTFQAYTRDAIFLQDSYQYTVMSYFDEGVTHASHGAVSPATPMLDDIAAIQRLYGANMATRTGDTTYGFNNTSGRAEFGISSATQQTAFAVWDAGGRDTFDFSGYADRGWIDLREEAFSSVGGLWNNIAIAKGVTIEDAIGGSGDDQIRGNGVGNRLQGGSGDDSLMGAAGNDTLEGGTGHDLAWYEGSRAGTTLTRQADGSWLATGPDGTDLLRGIEVVRFADGNRALVAVRDDFAATGTADILFRGPGGALTLWQMKGSGAEEGGGGLLGQAPAGATLLGRADFDGDRATDMLWRLADNRVVLWRTDSATTHTDQVISWVGPEWSVAGVADFDGDAKADILWRHADGTMSLWRMDGQQFIDGASFATVDATWSVAGTDDFNGDGKADILWRSSGGDVAIWLMDGRNFLGGQTIATVDAAWSIAGTGDFNGDDKADILWRNSDGTAAQWWMDSLSYAGGGSFATVDSAWKVAAVTDYGGDGRADILWRNDNGSLALWEMKGLQAKATGGLGSPGADWLVA